MNFIYGTVIILLLVLGTKSTIMDLFLGIDFRRAYYLDRGSDSSIGSYIIGSQPYLTRQMLLEPTRRLNVQKLIESAGNISTVTFKQLKKALANVAVVSKFSVMNNTEKNDFDSSEEKLEEAASEGPSSIIIKTPSRIITFQAPSLTDFMNDILLIPKKAIESANEAFKENSTETNLGAEAEHHYNKKPLDNNYIDLTTLTTPPHEPLDHATAPTKKDYVKDYVKVVIKDSEESDNDSHSDTDEQESNETLPAVNKDS